MFRLCKKGRLGDKQSLYKMYTKTCFKYKNVKKNMLKMTYHTILNQKKVENSIILLETENKMFGKPVILQSKGKQRVRHNWATQQQQQP